MYEELIKRLQIAAKWADKELLRIPPSLCLEAADAIEELSNAGSIYGKAWTLGYDAGRDENMPHWIPVTERLPEKPEGYPKCELRRTYYLVTLESRCVKTLGFEFDRNEWQSTGSPVVAWMPLLEPYDPPKEKADEFK